MKLISLIILFLSFNAFCVEQKVEIKLRVHFDDIKKAVEIFNSDLGEIQREEIFILNQNNGAFRKNGIVIRIKINHETKTIQSNIKVSGLDHESLNERFKSFSDLKCETNVTYSKSESSCAVSANLNSSYSYRSFQDLITKEQSQFINFYAKEKIDFTKLIKSNSFEGREWRLQTFGPFKNVKVEDWKIGPEKRFLELSYKSKNSPEKDFKKGHSALIDLGLRLDENPQSRLNSLEF
jgi:hypothetical protein